MTDRNAETTKPVDRVLSPLKERAAAHQKARHEKEAARVAALAVPKAPPTPVLTTPVGRESQLGIVTNILLTITDAPGLELLAATLPASTLPVALSGLAAWKNDGTVDQVIEDLIPIDVKTQITLALGNTDDDATVPAQNRYYVSLEGKPWALMFNSPFVYPAESRVLDNAYLKYGSWTTTGGVSNANWYSSLLGDYRVVGNLYNK